MNQSEPSDERKPGEIKRVDGQRASIAQLLLLARLRARNRRDLAVDSLERAAQVMLVTCKNWFSLGRKPVDKPVAPASDPAPHKDKDADAHQHY